MNIEIQDTEELQILFGKAYWIESNLELAIQWEAYMNMGEKHRDLLFTIAHDSEAHRMLLKRLCANIKGIDLEKEIIDNDTQEFNLSKMIDEEVFTAMLRYELLALDIYTKLHNLTNRAFLSKIWTGDSIDEYYNKLKWLIKEEERHCGLIKPLASKVARTNI